MSLLIKALEQAARDRDQAKAGGTPASAPGTPDPASSAHAAPAAPARPAFEPTLEPTLDPPPKPRVARGVEPGPRTVAAAEPAPLRPAAAPTPGTAPLRPAPAPAPDTAPLRTADSLSFDTPAPAAGAPAAPQRRPAATAAALSNIDAQQQRARAATVMQASGGSRAADLFSNLRGNPVMAFGALAVLLGIGFGIYVYLQIAQPGLFIRQAATKPQENPPPPPLPAPAPPVAAAAAGAPAPIPGAPLPGGEPAPANPAVAIPGAPPVAASAVPPSAAAPAAGPTISGSVGVAGAPAATASAPAAPASVSASSVIGSRGPDLSREFETAPRAPEPRRERGSARAADDAPKPPAAVTAAPTGAIEPRASSRERIAVLPAAQQPRVNPNVSQGYTQLQSGNLADAKDSYSKAVQAEPMNVDALLGLAYIAAEQNRSEEAMSLYMRILQVNPRHAQAQAAMIGLMGRADPLASESRLKQLIGREPSAFLYFVLGNIYADQSQWPQAQQAYFQAHHMEPDNPDYAYNLAIGLDHMRQGKPALNFYRRAEQLAVAQGRSNFDLTHARERIGTLSSQLE